MPYVIQGIEDIKFIPVDFILKVNLRKRMNRRKKSRNNRLKEVVMNLKQKKI